MAEGDFLDDRRRASEEDYFRKKDRELVEKMRKAAAADRAQGELSAKTGLRDPAMIAELDALGFTPETISVLPLVPIVQMAWAEGGITPAERTLLVAARERGIAEEAPRIGNSPTGWLVSRRPMCSLVPLASFERCSTADRGSRHDERRRSHQA